MREPEEPEVGRVLFGNGMVRAELRARKRSFTINLQLPIENNHRTWSLAEHRKKQKANKHRRHRTKRGNWPPSEMEGGARRGEVNILEFTE